MILLHLLVGFWHAYQILFFVFVFVFQILFFLFYALNRNSIMHLFCFSSLSTKKLRINFFYQIVHIKSRGVRHYEHRISHSTKLPMKGIAPCIRIGCRLAKECLVADVPEHYTSQTCSTSFGKCGPFHELEVLQRSSIANVAQKKKKNAPPKKKKRKHHDCKYDLVRGNIRRHFC